MPKEYTRQQVAAHRSREDIYIVRKSKVYDVTRFINMHPGGEEVILQLAGQDVTDEFDEVGHSEDAHKQLGEMLIGVLDKQSVAASGSLKSGKAGIKSRDSNRTFLCLLVTVASVVVYGMWHVAQH